MAINTEKVMEIQQSSTSSCIINNNHKNFFFFIKKYRKAKKPKLELKKRKSLFVVYLKFQKQEKMKIERRGMKRFSHPSTVLKNQWLSGFLFILLILLILENGVYENEESKTEK